MLIAVLLFQGRPPAGPRPQVESDRKLVSCIREAKNMGGGNFCFGVEKRNLGGVGVDCQSST